MNDTETTSQLLQRIVDEGITDTSSDQISIGEFIDKLADRGFGVLMLLCALPNFFPVNVPGISTIFSVILGILVLQWMVGKEHPWLPHFIRKRHMSEEKFANGVRPLVPKLEKIEKLIKPRQAWVFHGSFLWVIGLALLLQIAFLALPLSMIPFSNALPAYFIAAIAIGIITRDGAFTIGSMIVGTIGICLFSAVIVEVVLQLWQLAMGYIG